MNKLAKTTVVLMICTMITKILGFGRELILGMLYGTSSYSDIYIVTLNIPAVLFLAIGTALANIFIPLYYESSEKTGEENSIKFMNNLINIVLLVGVLISVIGFIYSEQLIKIFAIGFKGETLSIASKFLKIMILGVASIGLSSIFTAYLQLKNNFIIPGLVAVPYNICIIISMILSVKLNNIYMLAFGTLIAMVIQVIFQLPKSYKLGYRYKLYINLKDDYMKKIIWLVAPMFIGVSVNQINTIVDRTIASTLVEGSVSALNYANRLNSFVIGLFITTIGSVIYPTLSKLSSNNNKDNFVSTVVKSINIVILLVIPISVGAMVLAKPIIKLLFERGAFDARATSMTSIALIFYSIGMVGFGLRDILGKVFYSLQDTKTPMKNGVIAMIMNIVFNLVLVKFMGHAGLALGTSLSSLICILLLFISLKRKISYFGQDKIIKTTVKSMVSAGIMGIAILFLYRLLSNSIGSGFVLDAMVLFGSILIGALIYLILLVILNVEEVNVIIDTIKHKLNTNGVEA